MNLSRRSFFAGAAVLLAAPAIVRVSSIMAVSVPKIIPMTATELAGLDAEWLAAMQQTIEATIWYGDPTAHPLEFNGFIPFYSTAALAQPPVE